MKLKPTFNLQHVTPNAQRSPASRALLPVGRGALNVECGRHQTNRSSASRSGFTMIEIAICLAIIGFALIAIIGVLPLGMNTQRDNREETIINQDATVLLEAIRSGARGADDLTNYVYAITNYITFYDSKGVPQPPTHVAGYTYNASSYDGSPTSYYLTNAIRIIGILSTPEFSDGIGGLPLSDVFDRNYTSNHVVAYVRSISGLAAEKPPQDDSIVRENTLTYRLFCVNAPSPMDTNNLSPYALALAGNQRELRLTFGWPLMPNGKVINNGSSPLTFRATIAGLLTPTNYYNSGEWLYFYQSQSFTNAP
jgi:type II secretory pathway pseudopilin PulG